MDLSWRSSVLIVVLTALVSCATPNGKGSRKSTAPVRSGGGPVLVVQNRMPFSANAAVREAIRNECQLPKKLSHFTKEYAMNYTSRILSDATKAPKGAQILTVEIVSVVGGGGGTWSGGKSVSIQGILQQDGKTIGSFKGRRFSGGGLFGGYKGTCAIMGRCVKALGRDVAEWLRRPSQNAILGDL